MGVGVRRESGLMVRSTRPFEPHLVLSRCDTMSQNYFVPHIFVLKLTTLFLFNILSTCKYFQVPVDPQVLKNPRVFDLRLRVTRWLKPARIQVWHFEFEIPAGTDPGHPRVHSCSALLET